MNSVLTVSLKNALLSDEWDVIVTQQCSPDSGEWDTYEPFLSELTAYFRRYCPKALLWWQDTWSFEEGCPRFGLTGFANREEMIPALRVCYEKAAQTMQASGRIPALEAMNRLYDAVGGETYRDGFHASLGIGRYTLACLWFASLLGKDPTGNGYRDFDAEITEEKIALAQKIAKETAGL